MPALLASDMHRVVSRSVAVLLLWMVAVTVLAVTGLTPPAVAASSSDDSTVVTGYHYDSRASTTPPYDAAASATIPPGRTRMAAHRGYDASRNVSRAHTFAISARLATKGAGLLPKPVVGNAKLQNYVKDLYKGTTNPSRVGNGTTADAVRAELATGQATAGKFHLQKAQDTARGLENRLGRNRGATPHDRRVAQGLYDELIDAMGPHR